MAIVIIVEDGSGISNANAYVSVSDARAYAEARGVTLPTADDDVAIMLINATDYIESKACQFGGVPTFADQALSWPRTGFEINGEPFPVDAIPKNLVKAQCQLVIVLQEGFSLLPNVAPTDYVIEETVGPITTKYADPSIVGTMTTFTAVDALLAPLFGVCGQGGLLRSHRV